MKLGDVPDHLEAMLRLVEESRQKLALLLASDPLFSDAANKSLVSLTKASKDLSIELRHWSERMKEVNSRLTPNETLEALRVAVSSLPDNLRSKLFLSLGVQAAPEAI